MSGKEKEIIQTLADAIAVLPDGKKEYLIGYAEGVAAMAERREDTGEYCDEEEA